MQQKTLDRILATDLDGTFIPLDNNVRNQRDLALLSTHLQASSIPLIFVTGRHLASVENAIQQYNLPTPQMLICDVGSSIYQSANGVWQPNLEYRQTLVQRCHHWKMSQVDDVLQDVLARTSLRLQESEKQGEFKRSYYAAAVELEEVCMSIKSHLQSANAPLQVIHSLDPITGEGLIDVLPADTSKASALVWLADHLSPDGQAVPRESIVFAGDTGNDWAALTAGFRAILVANADRDLAQRVFQFHQEHGWQNRFFLATKPATSGVLEGCRWFELLDRPSLADTADAGEQVPPSLIGAEPISVNTTRFRIWAPKKKSVEVVVRRKGQPESFALSKSSGGYFIGEFDRIGLFDQYMLRIDHKHQRPDPAARYQPGSVHEWSQVMPPSHQFPWTDQAWSGVRKEDLIIYEMHVGAFTTEGTYQAAIQRLPALVELGVTAVELMPLAEAPGRWNWGYDGVGLFAPNHAYGSPNDLRQFVDACHACGLAVLLDVVYNHLGPEGNYLNDVAPYFSKKHHTPWGAAFGYDGPYAKNVRRFIIQNACYWIDEFHFDGLRLDAVHFLFDDSDRSILADIVTALKNRSHQLGRPVHAIAEANVNDPVMLRPQEDGGHGFDAIWCDDLMHSIYSATTIEQPLTYRPYHGLSDVELSLRHGYLYHSHQDRTAHADAPLDTTAESFVIGLQNHDSVGNHPHGKRIHHLSSVHMQMAAATLAFLSPGIPLIFMGEEESTDAPFHFFVDFQDERLRKAVEKGRAAEYPQHQWQGAVSPIDEAAFYHSVFPANKDVHSATWHWYQQLIQIRKRWRSAGLLQSDCHALHRIGEDLFVLQYRRNQQQVFAAARIGMASAEATTPEVPLHFAGQVIAATPNVIGPQLEGRVDLKINQAVVADGSLC